MKFLVCIEQRGKTTQGYFVANPAKVDDETSLGDTAVDAAKLANPGAFCYLKLDNRGKRVRARLDKMFMSEEAEES